MGKKFGKLMKDVNNAVMAMTQEQIAELENNGTVVLVAAGENVTIEKEDVEIISEDIPGWTIAQEGTITVALDIEITPELKNEGMARLIIKRIQAMRKDSQFEITDRIDVVIEENDDLKKAVDTFKEHIASQVLANSLVIGDAGEGSEQDFGEFKAKIFIKKN
jgi:isoleucyl-tRNA synthetase